MQVSFGRCLLPHGCLAAFLDDDAALAGAASQLEAESRNCQAKVGLLQIRCPGGHQARAFIARGHELRCGMLWSPRFAVERLRRPAQRTTSSKVRVHQLLGTTTSAPARARLCCRACCPTHSAETGRTRSNSLMINRSGARFFCCVTQLCLHPAGVDKSACFGVDWMETLDAVSNIVPRVFTCVCRGTPISGLLSMVSSLLSPLSSVRSPNSSLLSPLSFFLSPFSSLPCQSLAKGYTMETVESDSQPDKLHERISRTWLTKLGRESEGHGTDCSDTVCAQCRRR